eukprot:4867188-Pleurochrysis_carterae.AAC.1
MPDCERNAAMPSGRRKGPENNRRTRRDLLAAPTTWSAVRTSWGAEFCCAASGRPGGSDGKAGLVKYTSDVTTTRRPGTKTLKAPGECGFLPRLTPTQARGSMRVFDTADLGLTAKALQPNGMMPMTDGLLPVTNS